MSNDELFVDGVPLHEHPEGIRVAGDWLGLEPQPGVMSHVSDSADPTLVEFLLARIADDEADARLAMVGFSTGEWTYDGGVHAGHPMDEVVDWVYNDAAAHIARHDPARVLAECEAKRRIIEHHHVEGVMVAGAAECATCKFDGSDWPWPCDTLRLLALPYADHADYRTEWRPR